MDVVTDSTKMTLSDELSYNVLALTNPHWLIAAPAAGTTDLASAGLSHEIASLPATSP